jgi:hypothetical protein
MQENVLGADMFMSSRKKSGDSERSYSHGEKIVVDVGSGPASSPKSSVYSEDEDDESVRYVEKRPKKIKKIRRSRVSSAASSSYASEDTESVADDAVSEGSTYSEESNYRPKKMSQDEILNMKRELLYQFDRLEKKGVKLPRKFTLASSLEEMRAEYERLKCDREVENSVLFQRRAMMAVITGLEYFNGKVDPFNLKLDGWSESVNESINEYDDVFEELYMKYRGKAKWPPEVKLMLMLSGSAFMFHLNNSLFRSHMPGIDQVMRENPDLMKQFASATMNTMAGNATAPARANNGGGGGGGLLGGLLGSLMGGGGSGGGMLGGLGSALFGGGAMPSMPSMPPPQSTSASVPVGKMRGPTNVDDILNELNLNDMPPPPPHPMMPTMQDRIETMSTISDGDMSDFPDDASVSGVFSNKPKVIKRNKRTLDI